MVKVALLVGVSDYRPELNSLFGGQKDVEAIKRVLKYPDIGSLAEFKSLINFIDYGPDLNSLLGAQKDVEAMKRVLQHSKLGSFASVKPLLNPQPLAIEKAIESLVVDRQSDDLVLLYFSGYGLINDSGELYFVTAITRKNAQGKLVESTAVSARLVHKLMSRSQSKRQIVILDCCFIRDFPHRGVAQEDVTVAIKNQLGAEGRVVLTASTSTQYFFKHNESGRSTYTDYLVEGIETGAADLDDDGVISIGELHEYTSSKVQIVAPAIKPAIYEKGDKIWLALAPIANLKRSYHQAVERSASDGEISIVSRSALDELRESLGLLLEEATAIENAVLKPYRDYQIKLQYYAYFFSETHKSPLSDDTRNQLERFQQSLGLTDADITPIEVQLASQTEAVQSPQQVAGLPKVQIISGSEAVTPVKPPKKGKIHTASIPEILYAQRKANISLNKSAHSDSVPAYSYAQALIRAVLVAVMPLAGASYALHLWQDSQQVQKIKQLAEARSYEKCLTQAQAVPQKSSRYIDAQRLLKQCEAGVNWQNVQVTTLFPHHSTIWSIAFSPDGQTFASGSEDETIKIWDVRTRKLLRTLSGHSGHVWSIAISPSGQTLASSSGDKTIKIWNLQTGKLLHILTAHSRSVWSVAFSPNGQSLAAGNFDGIITVWHLGSKSLLHTLSGHSGSNRSVTFSPDGHLLTSGSGKTIKIWNFRTGELLRTLSGHTSQVFSVAISPSGQTLVSGSEDKTIKIWNLGSDELLRTLSGHKGRVVSVDLNPNGQTLASGSEDKTIKIWNLQTGKLLRTLSGHVSPVISVAFSPDGQTLASGSQDGTIKLWQRD